MAPIDGPYTTYYWSAIVNSSILHMGRCVTWVAIIRWVTWVMGQWVLTHDPSFFSIFGTYVLQYRIVE